MAEFRNSMHMPTGGGTSATRRTLARRFLALVAMAVIASGALVPTGSAFAAEITFVSVVGYWRDPVDTIPGVQPGDPLCRRAAYHVGRCECGAARRRHRCCVLRGVTIAEQRRPKGELIHMFASRSQTGDSPCLARRGNREARRCKGFRAGYCHKGIVAARCCCRDSCITRCSVFMSSVTPR